MQWDRNANKINTIARMMVSAFTVHKANTRVLQAITCSHAPCAPLILMEMQHVRMIKIVMISVNDLLLHDNVLLSVNDKTYFPQPCLRFKDPIPIL